MTRNVLLVTVESMRHDYADTCPVIGELNHADGITAGHYTRPSLAGLLSGQYRGALQSKVVAPTLPGVLSDAGYSTIGVSYSPQTVPAFGFDVFDSFEHIDIGGGRGSYVRERLGESRVVRAVYNRMRSKHATMSKIPRDERAVTTALSEIAAVDEPWLCWIHLMGSHRPYGWGAGALPKPLDAKAAGAPATLRQSISSAEHERIVRHYRSALCRVSERIEELLALVADDVVAVVTGDHGEELGEDGYYFHGGYRRRVTDSLVRVPLAGRNIDFPTPMGLAALPASICTRLDIACPDEWVRQSDSGWLTAAPWAGRATLRYTGLDGTGWVVRDADVEAIEAPTTDRDVGRQLAALGYRGTG